MKNVYDRWVFNTGEKEGQPNPRTWGKGWRYRVRYEHVTTGKLCDKTFPDGKKGEAQTFAAAQETHRHEGRQMDVKGGKQLIRAYGPAYVQSLVVKDSTRKRYNELMRGQIVPHLGGKQLIQCVSSTIQGWVRTLELEGFSPKTIQLAYDLVTAMFKRAIRDRLLSFTPCEEIKLPEIDDKEYWIPEHHQVYELAAAAPARYKAAIYIGAGCGLRWGETWALDMDAIDFEKKQLKVRRLLTWPKGSKLPALAKLKTKAAYREVPLPDDVIEALREHIAAGYVQEVKVIDQTAKVRKGQLYPVVTKRMLFAHDDGKILRTTTWSPIMAAARAAVDGVDDAFTFHGLRHYFASALIQGGANPKRVMKLCGHSKVEITLKVYTHFWKDDEEASRQILNNVFAAGAAKARKPLVAVPDQASSEPATVAA